MKNAISPAHVLGVLMPLVAGCTVGPDFIPPQANTIAIWTGMALSMPSGATTTIDATPANEGSWWAAFRDPELSSLIDSAASANFDIREAAFRIAEARSQLAVAKADQYPALAGDASYTRERFSEKTAQGSLFSKIGSLGSALAGGAGASLPSFPNPYDQFQVGFDASWEPDLFGRVRRSVEAANADMLASVEDSHEVLVSLESEVARNYIDLRGAQLKLAVARENVATQRDVLTLARQRRQAGLSNELDVSNAASQATSTESQLPVLERQIAVDINQISQLLAREPAALQSELGSERPVPPTPPQIGIGLPGDLVRRRPDIRAAEARLHAATARIGVATADLFPSLKFNAELGTQAEHALDLANWASRFYNIGPSLQLPIFEGGRLKATLRLQDVREEEAAVTYAKTVLTAVHDVENALVTFNNEERRHQSLESTVAENRNALDIARQRYAGGVTTFLDVLSAERTLEQNETALADGTSALSTDIVALYKALGGGWQEAGTVRTSDNK